MGGKEPLKACLSSPLVIPCELTKNCSPVDGCLVVPGARSPLLAASGVGLLLVISLVSEYDLDIPSCARSLEGLNSVRDLEDARTFCREEGVVAVAVVIPSVLGESDALLFVAVTPATECRD